MLWKVHLEERERGESSLQISWTANYFTLQPFQPWRRRRNAAESFSPDGGTLWAEFCYKSLYSVYVWLCVCVHMCLKCVFESVALWAFSVCSERVRNLLVSYQKTKNKDPRFGHKFTALVSLSYRVSFALTLPGVTVRCRQCICPTNSLWLMFP